MADRLKAETLADIIRAHKAARMTDNREKMASLEQALADFNYHTIRDLMAAGEYHKALRGQHEPV